MSNHIDGLSWKGYEGRDYEHFWAGPGKRHLDALERAIASHALPGGDAVVEIGAGFGRLGGCYVGKYRTPHMVEPASNLRASAASHYGDAVQYHEAAADHLPFADGSIDAVLMVRVFHHIAEPEAALREIHRVLAPGGRLVFNFSNKRNPSRILRYLTGRGPSPFTRDMEQYHAALIGHSAAHVEGLLADIGFDIVERYGVGFSDKLIEAVPALARVVRPSLTLARAIGPLNLAPAQFVVAIRR